ncbi:CYP4V2 [Cordylochernes scorpioides]|uniref:CYP4V2 n=1 Tax=Cordylochernes scorpioides TaxID=51811 RepID=A0ABY6L9G8_9ARAC|nr:CYP4V2 [Cordylochernes scorpioides]
MTTLLKDKPYWKFYVGSRPVVILHKPESAEALLTNPTLIEKSFEYSFLKPWLREGLITRILEDFVPVFNEQSRVLASKLDATNGSKVDILPYMSLCSLDIICGIDIMGVIHVPETAMGWQLGAQNDKESAYVQALRTVESPMREQKTWLNPVSLRYGLIINLKIERFFMTWPDSTESLIWMEIVPGGNVLLRRTQTLYVLYTRDTKSGTYLQLPVRRILGAVDVTLGTRLAPYYTCPAWTTPPCRPLRCQAPGTAMQVHPYTRRQVTTCHGEVLAADVTRLCPPPHWNAVFGAFHMTAREAEVHHSFFNFTLTAPMSVYPCRIIHMPGGKSPRFLLAADVTRLCPSPHRNAVFGACHMAAGAARVHPSFPNFTLVSCFLLVPTWIFLYFE